ncbi:MAG: glycine oxidase ThiO [Pyrinomonadaceae bacterium]
MAISDVLIVGGGVIGLSIARELHRKGVSQITILERVSIGREASYAAAGMLAPNAENDTHDDFYDLCSASCSMYPEFAAELLDETGVDIELERSGTLYLSFNEEDSSVLNRRYLWQREAGVAVEHLSAEETLELESFVSPDVRESLFYPDDWQVENRKLLAAFRRYADLNSIEIREQTEVRSLITGNGKVIGAKTDSETFFSGTTVLATGAWTSFIKIDDVPVPVNVKPIRGQMISFHPLEKMFRKVVFSRRGYVVPRMDGRVLSGATVEDTGFDRSTTEDGARQLVMAATEIAPSLAGLDIAEHWAGLRPFGVGGLPVLSEMPGYENAFVATAHFRNGILLAPVTAKLICEKIVDEVSSKYLDIFGVESKASAKCNFLFVLVPFLFYSFSG